MHTQLKLDYLPDAWVSFEETLGFFLPDIYRLLEQYRPLNVSSCSCTVFHFWSSNDWKASLYFVLYIFSVLFQIKNDLPLRWAIWAESLTELPL